MVTAKTTAKIMVVVVLAVFGFQVMFSAFGGLTYSAAVSSTSSLSQITLTSYNGQDSSAVADLAAGKIASYDFELTPTETAQLPSSFATMSTPSNLYDLLINPANTTYGFNPFQFEQVRQALNYVVDRNFFVESPTLLGGAGIAGISPYAGEPDSLVVANVTAQYSGYYNYSISEAATAMATVLKENGAILSGSGCTVGSATCLWMYKGSPVTVYVFDRTDDPIRHTYAGFLETQLSDLGFTVSVVAGDLSKEISVVYGADPATSTWTILPESWGGIYGYYDESLVASFTGTYGGYASYSDTTGLAMGAFNDSEYDSPTLIQQGNEADQLASNLLAGNFNTTAQRDTMLQNLTNLSFETATRIYLGTALNVYASNPSLVSNITPNFLESPVLNTMSYLTMTSTTGTANIGVRYLSQGAFNPIAGDTDEYTVDLSAGLYLPLYYYQPSTAYPYSIGVNWKLNSISDVANTPVPSDALMYNYTSGNFENVTSGTDAKTVVTVNFAPLFSTDKWADGQPITLADMLYQYVIAENATFNSNSPIYDTAAGIYAYDLSTVAGFQILNSTSIKIYSTFFYPDSNYAALSAFTDMFPLGYALPGGNMLPWQLYQAMANVVGSGKAAWSSSAANTKGIDWLSLTNPQDVGAVNTALSTYAASSYVPAQLTQLQKITGVSLVSTSSALSGYTAATSFITANGNAVISDGPYYLASYQTTNTPNYAILKQSPYFQAGSTISPQLFAQATSITTSDSSVPAIVSQGSSISVTTYSAVIGSKAAATGQAGVSVTAQFIANNAVVLQEKATSGTGGTTTFAIPTSLAAGTYTLTFYASSVNSTLIQPVQTSITVTSSSASSTTSHSTASITSTSTTTSSNSNDLIAAVAVIIIIIVIGAVFAMRRRSPATPAAAPSPS